MGKSSTSIRASSRRSALLCFHALLSCTRVSTAVAEERIKQLVSEVQKGTQSVTKARAAASDAQAAMRQRERELEEVGTVALEVP